MIPFNGLDAMQVIVSGPLIFYTRFSNFFDKNPIEKINTNIRAIVNLFNYEKLVNQFSYLSHYPIFFFFKYTINFHFPVPIRFFFHFSDRSCVNSS